MDSMEWSTNWEAKSSSTSQKFSRIHNSPPLVLFLNEPDESSPCSHSISWRCILLLFLRLRAGLAIFLFPQVFLPTACMHMPPMHATCPAPLIHLCLITRVLFGGKCRHKFFHHSVSSLIPAYLIQLTPKYLSQQHFLELLNPMSFV
jgi:hypothetical protein